MRARSLASTLTLSALAIGAGLLLPPWPSAQAGPHYFRNVVAAHSHKCISVNSASQQDGAPAQQWDCLDQTNLKFEVVLVSPNQFYLKPKHSDKCLAVQGGSRDNGAAIVQWTCQLTPEFLWTKEPAQGGVYLRNARSNKCIHVHGGGDGNGAAITQWDCINQKNVIWNLREVD